MYSFRFMFRFMYEFMCSFGVQTATQAVGRHGRGVALLYPTRAAER